jgi:hypothetical protein
MATGTVKSLEHSRITVGIVTYNSAGYIGACLASIATYLKDAIPTVIVFDNGSSDGTPDVLTSIRKIYPYPLEIILNDKNMGYAWGVNRIAEKVKTEWMCFINPDARLTGPVFDSANEVSKRVPTSGVVGGIMVDSEGKMQESGGVFPTPSMAVWDWCGLRHIFPRKNWSTSLQLDVPPDGKPKRIDYPTGAFWVLRWEVFNRVGPFDERYFLYFEETDFCKRAKELGWPSYIHPGIRVEHVKGASFSENQKNIDGTDDTHRDPLSIYFESLLKYLKKHFPEWKVKTAIWEIGTFLKLRRWILKNDKSERIYKAFTEGNEIAESYIEPKPVNS